MQDPKLATFDVDTVNPMMPFPEFLALLKACKAHLKTLDKTVVEKIAGGKKDFKYGAFVSLAAVQVYFGIEGENEGFVRRSYAELAEAGINP